MNDNKFENLMLDLMTDDEKPSYILNARLKQKIKKKCFIKNSFKAIKTAVACVAVITAGAAILVNSNKGISNKLSDIPVIGNVAKVMTVNDFSVKGTHTPSIQNKEGEKREAIDDNTQKDEVKENTENVTPKKPSEAPQKYTTNKIIINEERKTEKKSSSKETTKEPPKSEEVNTEVLKPVETEEKITKIQTVEPEMSLSDNTDTVESNMPKGRSIDNESDIATASSDGNNEESVKAYHEAGMEGKKLSELFEDGYDYKSVISEKIINQINDAPQNEYFVGENEFVSITGDEEFYLNEENELIIIFDEGEIAPKEKGRIEINVGKIE